MHILSLDIVKRHAIWHPRTHTSANGNSTWLTGQTCRDLFLFSIVYIAIILQANLYWYPFELSRTHRQTQSAVQWFCWFIKNHVITTHKSPEFLGTTYFIRWRDCFSNTTRTMRFISLVKKYGSMSYYLTAGILASIHTDTHTYTRSH